MTERRLSAAAEQFFESRIASLLHLEILLLLRRDPTRWLNAPDVAAVRRVSDETGERVLEQLAAANLIDIRIRGRLTFRFAPTESTVLPLMDEIAVAHHDDRQALERLLGRGRGGSGAARAFADASGCREGRQVPSLVYSLCAVTSRLCSVLLLVRPGVCAAGAGGTGGWPDPRGQQPLSPVCSDRHDGSPGRGGGLRDDWAGEYSVRADALG